MAEETQTTSGAKLPEAGNPARRRGRPPVKIQPPLMPLIDVMFTLMLFFLVTCQYRQKEGALPTVLPTFGGASAGQTIPAKPIRLIVSSSADAQDANVIHPLFRVSLLGGPGVQSEEELFAALESLQARLGSTDVPVIIAAADDEQWEFVVQAFNQVLRLKFKNVAFGSRE